MVSFHAFTAWLSHLRMNLKSDQSSFEDIQSPWAPQSLKSLNNDYINTPNCLRASYSPCLASPLHCSFSEMI